jgi:hypothetical protein
MKELLAKMQLVQGGGGTERERERRKLWMIVLEEGERGGEEQNYG